MSYHKRQTSPEKELHRASSNKLSKSSPDNLLFVSSEGLILAVQTTQIVQTALMIHRYFNRRTAGNMMG